VAEFGEAVRAWASYYEDAQESALERLTHMAEHGIPEGHEVEWLGAGLALTPPERRCDHFGDTLSCPDCHRERVAAKREERRAAREAGEREEALRAKDETIVRQSEAIDNQSAALAASWRKIRALDREVRRLRQRRWIGGRTRDGGHSRGADSGSRYEPDR
jgi:hypothetical protein